MRSAKTTAPRFRAAYQSERLFRELDLAAAAPIIWISAPAGAGKTTLVESYLRAGEKRHIWYQIDERDDDVATLFYVFRASP